MAMGWTKIFITSTMSDNLKNIKKLQEDFENSIHLDDRLKILKEMDALYIRIGVMLECVLEVEEGRSDY